ncbi:CopD family protein [Alkalilimnicola sp. S0819]|uniref:CopD family protein n=1 Tax=Alkalilimnicola sp. S0819 TaxID=2613922 RepID=UPI0012623E7F|nr:CopD family protein [Alkalilimnicola sp. S0819]KAB7623968.1 hypothetical protein F3N43_07955 [Alkalilimnicola sp. S0819]MPQ16569.1 hypothetical protein [Alkalilimnicola sp. S0819]
MSGPDQVPWAVVLHILFICLWLGTLSLVPALCAEHRRGPGEQDQPLIQSVLHLYAWGASGCAVLAVLTGIWLAYARGFEGGWLALKLGFVTTLAWCHLYIGRLAAQLRDNIVHAPLHYWSLSLLPPMLALPILYLVLSKPL